MEIHRRNVESLGRYLEEGLDRPIPSIPAYQTITPWLRTQTRYVGALDGSDQQLFAYLANPELGVGIWSTLYCELDLQNAGQETYRDGPISAGAWSEDELLMYHLTIALPDRAVTKQWRNNLYAARQILANIRATEPPLFSSDQSQMSVRNEAARERSTGEWLALHAAIVHQLGNGDLLLKDGRFNCQIEIPAHWVDELGRRASRNGTRMVGVVKSGLLYQEVYPVVQAISQQAKRPFWFIVPELLITQAYENETNKRRKTLMLGGKDNDDLAGIGALWTVFCPDPYNFRTFVVLEFNVYDLWYYKELARTPKTLRDWQNQLLNNTIVSNRSSPPVLITDLLVHSDHDINDLVEPTIAEILWLCEQEVAHFGYPNLLGIAHRDVALSKKKVDQLRYRYRNILAHCDRILEELVDQDFVETPHKLHNID